MRWGGPLGIALILGFVAACIGAGAFECESDEVCVNGNVLGLCQPGGFCSFPDDACSSGQRYGEQSGSMAGMCVPVADSTSSVGTGGTTGTTGATTLSGSSSTTATSSTGPAITSGPTDSTGTPETTDVSTSEGSTGSVDPDLVLWLKLDDDFDTVAEDSSQFANDGTCSAAACPQSIPGIVDGAARFDGAGDFVEVPSAAQFDTPDGLTLAVWVRVDAMPFEHRAILTKPLELGNFNTWELYFFPPFGDQLLFSMALGTSDVTVAAPDPVVIGAWTHFAGTWDGAEMVLWVDGAPVDSADLTEFTAADTPVFVGADRDSGVVEGFFEGAIDDVRIYSRALSPAEIAALAGA